MFGYKILVVTLQRFWSINIVLLLNQKKMKKLVLLLAVAFSMSLVSCGGAKADAEAAAIYTKAYSQDAKFYEFWKSLESYKKSIIFEYVTGKKEVE